MKKVAYTLLSCFFILFLFQQQAIAVVSPSLTPIREEQTPGRQLPRKLILPAEVLSHKEKYELTDKLEESKVTGSSTSMEHNSDEEERLINTADYHVVTTHNSPSPKHPKP